MRVEVVRWLDSGMALSDGWQSPEWFKERARTESMEVVSVGIPMHEDDEVVVLAATWDPALDQYLNAQVIVKANILARSEVASLDDEEGKQMTGGHGEPNAFDIWQGVCGHLWRFRDHGNVCPVCPTLSAAAA